MRQFKRADRLNQQILRDVSELLETELADVSPGMTTFTAVRLTKDLRIARVYYSFFGNEEDRTRVEAYLNSRRKRIRSRIGKNLNIRHVPELTFTYDASIERGVRIEELLNEIGREDKK
ncbi:MAG: 30S ribosome-binding factor RbfA [Candidatus Zixiibacteriota bacterium]|nr:MAG: 30S ribosome-binding factor RbfA [candidate division Zixibacteria bacterium]